MSSTEQFLKARGWIMTLSGRRAHLEPQPDQFDIHDIANALARVQRYGGHVGRVDEDGVPTPSNVLYSVAEHSVLGVEYLEAQGASEDLQRAFLLHDASEAYLGDFPSPFKKLLRDYQQVEAAFERAIADHFGVITRDEDALLREVDRRIQLDEVAELQPVRYHPVGPEGGEGPLGIEIRGWGPSMAHQEFILHAERLGLL